MSVRTACQRCAHSGGSVNCSCLALVFIIMFTVYSDLSAYAAFAEPDKEYIIKPFKGTMRSVDSVTKTTELLRGHRHAMHCYLIKMTTHSFDQLAVHACYSKDMKSWIYQWLN